ncbi:hypothetical protein PVAND_012752 [Polypedilum vanderplanki]|uniref:C-type lectin domain-containing protein n=1 Tax=Polypedilum vanderplanki TaxID=319348 RepID=A0A9J6CMF9_POLVA|nr:hypothetical protein PVAND_012752 [Polypedilum vanderplanki]
MKTKISMKLILIGLLSQIDFSHSRAVNISNTWTLPQAGFNVFYRYFRDKISWFEADAVCQFHHANLVTVENMEQFDATRLFLKELDIPDFVWIGLMRPSNTDQFSWTNSKPLPVSEGYWAEPWPVSETPLCAVIDPSRDYRWHALRCGGPETAAFLCEMEIPDWAIHCTENPEVTVQYISDSGAVQVSRRCKDSLKEVSCQTKETQMDMQNALKCPEEEEDQTTTVESATENTVEASKLSTEVTMPTTTEEIQPKVIIKNPQKMMEDIFDTIDVNVEVDSNRLDETNSHKMDLDLMVGDQPLVDDEEPTEDKKILLKQQEKKEIFPKKSAKIMKEKSSKMDDMMMGDAPVEEVHSTTTQVEVTSDSQTTTAVSIDASSSSSDMTTEESTEPSSITSDQMTTTVTEEATTKIIVQGHPLHMSQAIFKEPIQPDINNTHERIDIGNSDDRFIPPMLLVKAKFTTTTSSGEIITTVVDTATAISSTEPIIDVTDIADENSTFSSEATTIKIDSNEIPLNDSESTQLENAITTAAASEKPILIGKRNDPRLGLNAVTTSTTTTTTIAPSTTFESTSTVTDASTTENEELTSTVTEESSSMSESTSDVTSDTPLSSSVSVSIMTEENDASSVSELATTTLQTGTGSAEKLIDLSTTTIISSSSQVAVKRSPPSLSTTFTPSTTTAMRNDIPALDGEEEDEQNEDEHNHQHVDNNFSNAENFQPYKPNRHRSLSKLDHHHGPGFSIGKILG